MVLNKLKTSALSVGYRQMKVKFFSQINLHETRARKLIKRGVYEMKRPNDIYHLDRNNKSRG